MQYASMSFTLLIMIITILTTIFFSGAVQTVMDVQTLSSNAIYGDDWDTERDYSGTPLWSDIEGGDYWREEFEIKNEFDGISSGIFTCKSVDYRIDRSDIYAFNYDEYHIKIISNSNFSLRGDILIGNLLPDLIEDLDTEKELSVNNSNLEIFTGPRVQFDLEDEFESEFDFHMSSKNDFIQNIILHGLE